MKMDLIPMLPVVHLPASIEFYEKLGFAVEHRNDDWGWAMLVYDDCRIMLDRSINTHPEAPRQSVIYLYPEDLETFHRTVLENGIDAPPLDDTFYNMTEFRIDDPDGNRLWIGTVKV